MVEKPISFEGKKEKDLTRVFLQAYKNAFTKSTEHLFSKCFSYAPVGKTKQGAVNLRNALTYDFDMEKGEGCIGLPAGSPLEKIATYVEMGTGERGSSGWTQFFEEQKPSFTIPIVPLKAKTMYWVNEAGQGVFMKTSKGQRPQAFMRRAFRDGKRDVESIWENEFSEKNIKKLLKMKKN